MHKLIPPIVDGATEVYTDLVVSPTKSSSRSFAGLQASTENLAGLLNSSIIKPLKPISNEIRVFKSDAEIVNMRKAGQISGRVFTEAMRRNWTTEKDLAAFLDYKFRQNGCDGSAYVPVVAGGEVRVPLPGLGC